EVVAAGKGKVLEIGAERVVDRGDDRVDALVQTFVHDVARVVDDIDVVALPARHGGGTVAAIEAVVAGAAVGHGAGAATVERVVADAASEAVVAVVSGDDVVERVAGAVDVAAAGQGEVLDIGAERGADGRAHLVGAFVGGLGHGVAGIVDDVDVVAGT